ncbi:MAG: 4Fe-4S dicluster domain-containing protein [Desulfobacula sp.]|nr:4Fe-4S dicluster domain-containing protein [Desulfobacula sp.]
MIEVSFYAAIIVFIIGAGIQFFRLNKNKDFSNPKKSNRPQYNIKGFFLNTFLQAKLFKAGKVRWAVHFVLFLSFLYLLIVHGLHAVTAELFFSDYEPTLDPFQFLRNVSGFFVLAAGIAFIVRRSFNLRINQDKRIKIHGLITVIVIVLLIGSGFLLEASKIISEPIFMEMVEEYSDIDDEELIDLKLHWKDNYAVFFQEDLQSAPEQLENGQVLNEEYCLYCHSPIKSAGISRAVVKAIYSAGQWFNVNRIDKALYWFHYGLCLIILICLPFSRLLHIFLIPFSSSQKKKTVHDYQKSSVSINLATLYACTNCGYCSQVCNIYPNYQINRNPDVLPHAKIESVKGLLKDPSSINKWQLNAGNGACTLCYKCTDICPSGIDLQSLWTVLDKKLGEMGAVDNNDLINETSLNEWMAKEFISNQKIKQDGSPNCGTSSGNLTSTLADRIESFENCIQCTICTNVCPILGYDSNGIDMTPHQIMNLLRLGEKHLATSTRMVWSCLTCYACQENCPQEIQVTDILLELRNAGGMTADIIQKNKLTEKLINK